MKRREIYLMRTDVSGKPVASVEWGRFFWNVATNLSHYVASDPINRLPSWEPQTPLRKRKLHAFAGSLSITRNWVVCALRNGWRPWSLYISDACPTANSPAIKETIRIVPTVSARSMNRFSFNPSVTNVIYIWSTHSWCF